MSQVISALLDTVLGSALNLLLLVIGLLPAVDVSALPLAVPESVQSVLSALNWFVPIGDLITILTVWIGLLIAANVAMIIWSAVRAAKG